MQVKIIVLVAVSIVIAVLLATALGSFTRVPDAALTDTAPNLASGGNTSNAPRSATKNYLPIIFLNSATAGGTWLLAGNAGTNWNSDFLGTTDNMTLTLRVSNTVAFRIVPAVEPGFGFAPNLIGGSEANSIAPGIRGATIAGGGLANYANLISGQGSYATVGGGGSNTASGYVATVAGGQGNSASGSAASVPGGLLNVASGTESFAAGCHAKANHPGAFVWSDSTCTNFTSTANDQFLVRASGGVGINTNVPSRTLEVNGKIGVYDSARNFYGGIATEVGTQLIDFGINDDGVNRFGGAYSSAMQGGLVRVDTRNGFDLFQFQGRQAGTTTLSQLASLNSAGKFTASGGFNGQCLTGSNFNTTAGGWCNMDVAEGFAATEWTAPGDVVALVRHMRGAPTVRKATGAEEEVLVGVVSQNPGLVFDNGTTHLAGDNSNLITADKTVVALVGRVNVKVSVENGVINIGDALTSSRAPGMAMRATQASRIIGYAMEEANADGMVLALVQPGYYLPGDQVTVSRAELEEMKTKVTNQDARLTALEQGQAPASNALTLNALAPWGVVGLLAVWMMRKKK